MDKPNDKDSSQTYRFMRDIRYVPTLPTILAQILGLLNDDRSSASDLEKIITHDQSMSSKVLAVANSAYYGFRHQIITVRRAVVALGYEEIRNICLGASLVGFLHPSTFRDRRGAELLWFHSLSVAEASRVVAKFASAFAPEASFTAGLLHDLGKVVLAAYFPDEAEAIEALRRQEQLSFRQAEQVRDADHCQIGWVLGQHWDLPPQLVEAMTEHHKPRPSNVYYDLTCVVHAGNFIARDLQLGYSGNPDPPDYEPSAFEHLGLEPDKLEECTQKVESRRRQIIDLWKNFLQV